MTTSHLFAGDLATDGFLAARPGDTWLADNERIRRQRNRRTAWEERA